MERPAWQVALIGAKGAPKSPDDCLAGGSVIETHAFEYGEVRLLNYDADAVTSLRGEHRNLYKCACCVAAVAVNGNRVCLRQARAARSLGST